MTVFRGPRFGALSSASFFGHYHFYLVGFIIATFLATFVSDITLGWIISGASILSAASLGIFPRIFTRFGTRHVLVTLGFLQIVTLLMLAYADSAPVAAILFALEGILAYNMFLG